MTVKISENHLVSGHASVLQNELDHSRKVSEETSERLATTAYDLDNLQKMKVLFVFQNFKRGKISSFEQANQDYVILTHQHN